MIKNVHERELPVPAEQLGALLDRLSGPDDVLWPAPQWPAMKFDRPLGVGADGGHGFVRYTCTAYVPGKRVEFTFGPKMGLVGTHTLEVDGNVLRHSLVGRTRGSAVLLWPLVIRWMHDACLEDLLDNAGTAVGHPSARPQRWSPWVRLLHAMARRFEGGRPQPKLTRRPKLTRS